ncbi:hypothetical protein BCR44DRAFT_61076 [Catenaria anguillulae PL171]|uniref:Uncharacterized protein n=1 Tax=Catenaria anguillulae PL171 TaxID=765915 RepID=A0A1Y2HMN0_9FUNG|nr:hypothetical protein BCR44DRAFT_61076 [Catenaria anguillulae PL171]
MKSSSLLSLLLVLIGLTAQTPGAHSAPVAPTIATFLQGRTTTTLSVWSLFRREIDTCPLAKSDQFQKCIENIRSASGSDHEFAVAMCFDKTCNA